MSPWTDQACPVEHLSGQVSASSGELTGQAPAVPDPVQNPADSVAGQTAVPAALAPSVCASVVYRPPSSASGLSTRHLIHGTLLSKAFVQ